MLESRVVDRVPAERPGDPAAGTCTRWPPTGSTTTARDGVEVASAMSDALLPAEFADLEPFAGRGACRPSASATRNGSPSTMDEMQAFYDAVFPRAEEAIEYLRQVPARRHARRRAATCCSCCYSLVIVSFPVEVWRQPRVPDSGAAYLDLPGRADPVSRDGPSRPFCAPTAGSTSTRARCGRRRWSWSRAIASPRSTPTTCPTGATEIDLGDVTLLPGPDGHGAQPAPRRAGRREPAQRRRRTTRRSARLRGAVNAARRCAPGSRPCATSACS